jgi:hypothetical protein
MSRRRLALNIPILQRHLSFTAHRNPAPMISFNSPSLSLLPLIGCLTPITPTEQMVHTPLYPPQLNRPDPKMSPARRKSVSWNSIFFSPYASSSPHFTSSPPQLPDLDLPRPSKPTIQSLTRRLSLVAPPDASPVHMPRRLSYSRFANIKLSPLLSKTGTTPITCADANGLDSPLVINTPRWISRPSVSKHLDYVYFPFHSPSPNTAH